MAYSGADLSDGAAATGVIAAAEAAIARTRDEIGAPRIVVNCAGIGVAERIVGREGPMELGHFARVININLIGSFNIMRLAAADMAGQVNLWRLA